MQFITDFADQAVLLPLALAFALFLAVSGWWRGAGAFLLAVAAVLGVMGVLKVLFYACTAVLGATGIHSPSGHTAGASIVLGGMLVLLLRGRAARLLVYALPVAVALLIGTTRIELRTHTPEEALFGAAIGLSGVAAMVALAGIRPRMRLWPAGLVAVLIVAGLHGLRLPAEQMLHAPFLLGYLPLPAMCRT